jgi:DNA-directed RNA polymerase subunit RPC12/RpoP
MRTRYYCADCLTAREHGEAEAGDFSCAKCGKAYTAGFEGVLSAEGVEQCAFCGNHAFFLQKDFDQRLGCLIMGVSLAAALFVGWKFGWIWFTPVLLATVVVDWIVAAKIRPVTICYRCDAEYREIPVHPRHKGYDPHVAERYAEKKTVRRMR